MKSIFVTGITGSGKTTLSQTLQILGYEAYNIEHDDFGLFMMIRRDTGEPFLDYDNADMTKVHNASWICDKEKLKALVDKQKENLAFYCGIAGNNAQIMPIFDMSILLKVSPEILNKRLLTREGTDDYANTEAGRQKVLSGFEKFENDMMQAGMIVVDADASPKEVAKEVIKLANK